ncbi:hypothetical protein ACTXT7_011409 [Hymenolepis weldensis]
MSVSFTYRKFVPNNFPDSLLKTSSSDRSTTNGDAAESPTAEMNGDSPIIMKDKGRTSTEVNNSSVSLHEKIPQRPQRAPKISPREMQLPSPFRNLQRSSWTKQ